MKSVIVSVIMPCLNEAKYLPDTIESIRIQTFPHDQLEVLVIDGGSSDGTQAVVRMYQDSGMNIQLLRNPRRHISAALNLGLNASRGDFVVRMDAHTIYEPDYIEVSVRQLRAGVAEAVGGRQEGRGAGYWGRVIAIATQSFFGSGGPAYKVSSSAGYVDTVYLGAWRRSTLLALGGWCEDWQANEDYELFYRLRSQGGRVLLDPAIRSQYRVRESLGALARQYFSYGQWKVKTLVDHPDSGTVRHFANPSLVLGFILGMVLVPWFPGMLFGELIAYFTAVVLASVHAALRNRVPIVVIGLPVAFLVIHFSWGLGFLRGGARFGWPLGAAKRVLLRRILTSAGHRRSSDCKDHVPQSSPVGRTDSLE